MPVRLTGVGLIKAVKWAILRIFFVTRFCRVSLARSWVLICIGRKVDHDRQSDARYDGLLVLYFSGIYEDLQLPRSY